MKATGSIAKVVMNDFMLKYGYIPGGNEVEIHMLQSYVDDILNITKNLEIGDEKNIKKRWSEEYKS